MAVNVLVFPCGSENALEIHQALTHSIHVQLFGASSVDDHGRQLFDTYCGDLPRIDDGRFDQAFEALLAEWKIDLVFATHDTVQAYLSERAQRFGVRLVNGDPDTCAIARRKSLTYAAFADQPWIPITYTSPEEVEAWPAVVKPDLGQGGQGFARVSGVKDAYATLERTHLPLLQEYLPGEEITVDCFSDYQHELRWVGARHRERVRAGISMRSTFPGPDPVIDDIAATLNQRLRLRGPWFFQLKRDRQQRWKLLEISCRVAGSMVAHRARGVNLPLMAIHDHLQRRVSPLPLPEIDLVERRILTVAQLNCHFDTVYIDFDDTVIRDGLAIPSTLNFLYRMHFKGKRLILVTRHAGDPRETLRKARIAVELFDEIIHITDGRAKSEFIRGNAIFIDNHFPERLDVATHCAIPVFDVDALEFLS